MVRLIILVLVLILALSYFGISIREIATSPTGQENFSFVWMYIQEGWYMVTSFVSGFIESARNLTS